MRPYGFLGEYPTVILEDFSYSQEKLHGQGRGDVIDACEHEEDAWKIDSTQLTTSPEVTIRYGPFFFMYM
eukprot:287443-Amorphochlora_amoeboformis.AAC.3